MPAVVQPDAAYLALLAKLVEIAEAVDGLAMVLDHEPQNLPRTMPLATFLLVRSDPQQAETGVGEDVTYTWRLSVYVQLHDFKAAQLELAALAPRILRAFRHHPTADDLVDFLRVEDVGAEPVFAIDQGTPGNSYARKELMVVAVLTET